MTQESQESTPAPPDDAQRPHTQPVLYTPTPQQLRDELADLVVTDLLGPIGGAEEELVGNPTDHYIIGRLAPGGVAYDGRIKLAGLHVEPGTLDEAVVAAVPDAEEGDPDPDAPNVPSLQPSSLGLTARIDGAMDELRVRCSWARYELGHSKDPEHTGGQVWHRTAFSGWVTVKLLEDGVIEPRAVLAEEFPGVVVRGRARRHQGDWLVSLFLVNGQEAKSSRDARSWLFQVELAVSGLPDTAPFLPRRPQLQTGGDPADRAERKSLAMTYRFHPEFAVGHGTGVRAEPSPEDPLRAVEITTKAAPSYEIPHTDVPDPLSEPDADLVELRGLVLDMKRLAECEQEELRTALMPLVDGYRAWIERTGRTIDDPDARLAGYEEEARTNLQRAAEAADRIEAGIGLLAEEAAFKAFRFANQAMWRQRVHTLAAADRRHDPELALQSAVDTVDIPENRSWRPFQLAFLLLNLPALADPGHPERSADEALADLLWFPTGGGKTEAYLGLAAFAMAIRRCGPTLGGLNSEDGVTALMRYTLRLLTIQQFQRAAALICACETIRRCDPDTWGRTPFRIGLWVGGAVTPNSTDQANGWLKDRRQDKGRRRRSGTGSPHQLTSCPWCGTKLDAGRDIAVDMTLRRTFIICPDVFSCPFGAAAFDLPADERGLPVLVVDEEIYRLVPTLLIATVDKFAQLPWKGETQTLFGQVARRCSRHGYVTADAVDSEWERASHPAHGDHSPARTVDAPRVRPPDLIIQDELHLISGPLGSLTGLYEAAVDKLATWEIEPGRAARPKVIASTATVRRAERQINDLFARKTAVFPPPGLTAEDNFFARRRSTDATPGRRYVGICAQGVRTKSVAIRVYVAQLAAARLLHDRYGHGELTDPYMTLVGYFNSLRDLGGMRRLVEDDISTRLTRADGRGLAVRFLGEPAELTSRMSSDAIPDILEKLELSFTGPKKGSPRPLDVLLATNMIAVGVDVSRLGVMIVNNQPKSTAEYIQATSRVGRRAPGLVFNVLNWARPRDLSHYETFESFHATVYQHVEALSVTPFADRAVDRGLTGVLVALVRDLKQEYNANRGAQFFDTHGELADHVVRYLQRRAEAVTEDDRVGAELGRRLGLRLKEWERRRKAPGAVLGYRSTRRQGDVTGLLKEPDGSHWQPMTCPTSLREVEPPVNLMFVGDIAQDATGEPPFTPRPCPSAATDDPQEKP
ncbi:DISARM system helicase DrmA [Streptantibioticus ferralitis]|uniref:DISARM system helicase DrmA n=1 Tax=Streptantibioticus ferralitis TaxID=236510 RepID=A0ABT5Z6S0_9ACTN|nr:DISARM system helicase DrmA [Streptantibioticus ferralitis]MDF2259503.1 DISARM system helicase DrmA [Streptantibioticus ferralitis]